MLMVKKYKLEALQDDLKNGLTLQEALLKHNLTFKEAVTHMPRPQPKKSSKRGKK